MNTMNNNPNQEYRLLSLHELQSLQFNVMKLIHAFCCEQKIGYYIIGGTLLGAVRHNGFIPWDDDIDIAMKREDYERFKKLFNTSFDLSRFFLQSYSSDEDFAPAMLRVCIKGTIQDLKYEKHLKKSKNTYIDIFPLDYVPKSRFLQILQCKLLKCIDKVINLKLYRIHENNSYAIINVKRLVSFLLRIIPLCVLQKLREKAMTMYNNTKRTFLCSTVSQYGYEKQLIKEEVYGIPTLYSFNQASFYGVSDYDAYLKQIYGTHYMQVPVHAERRVPTDVYIDVDHKNNCLLYQ